MKHKQQWQTTESKKPPAGLPGNRQPQTARVLPFFRGEEFESCLLPGTSKKSDFASSARYFYFTALLFENRFILFFIFLEMSQFHRKIPHKSAGFLPASLLSMQVGKGDKL